MNLQLLFLLRFGFSDLIGQNRLLNNIDEFNTRKFHQNTSSDLPARLVMKLAKHLVCPSSFSGKTLDQEKQESLTSFELAKSLIDQLSKRNFRKFNKKRYRSRYDSFMDNFHRH